MTQPYFNPYQSAAGYSPNIYEELLGPAKKASIFMIILGALLLCIGVCAGVAGPMMGSAMNDPSVPAESQAQFRQIEAQFPGGVKSAFIIWALIVGFCGIADIVLGIMVRRGGIGWNVTAMVIHVLLLLFLAGIAVLYLTMGILGGLCLLVIPIVLIILIIMFLSGAIRNASRLTQFQMQYQMQMWQYQQQQQQAQGHGAGYGQPQTPQSPQQPPPPAGPPT